MLRTVKPKNARSKRALEKREAREFEAAKTAVFVKGSRTSAKVNLAMQELSLLKKPDVIPFNKKNEVQPFEDTSSFDFWSSKNDASLFLVGNSQKKRPDNLTWIRMFDGKVLDMIETGVVEVKSMQDFKGPKPGLGMRPLFHFSGPQFHTPDDASVSTLCGSDGTDADPTGAYQQLKSMLLDFYRGEELKNNQIALSGLQHLISVTAAPISSAVKGDDAAKGANGDATLEALYKAAGLTNQGTSLATSTQTLTSPEHNLVHIRIYTIQMLASGSKLPRIELSECGPSLDLTMRRRRPAPLDVMTAALRRPKTAEELNKQGKGKKKNIETDDMGDMVGRIHVGRQDLGDLQTRKMKGLKRGGDDDDEGAQGSGDDGESGPGGESDDDDDEQVGYEDDDDEEVYGEEDASDEELEMEDMTMPVDDDEGDEEEDDEDEKEAAPAPPPARKAKAAPAASNRKKQRQ
ncbi:uncharacterized protein PFL1_00657 [Pseudozyma flocculosa PF-1]|uniref:Ribosome production factor 2 homolog n=1 Tax=Pseudozyma flocculosa TaxID=84751 RepID=A0A5C3ERS7_9BASI|nr:uncharacterized protein PFL1_00657 [Pseudozyma flocculosa PF-1]EPQ32462.1 hypothetical protein PFL1_00657 [Pseudozyma flocculosa PF-1]SPO34550.1 related to protein RPF2 involved in ribosomal large subunit assembly and maintenance [Pseudozyma flocculosa]